MSTGLKAQELTRRNRNSERREEAAPRGGARARGAPGRQHARRPGRDPTCAMTDLDRVWSVSGNDRAGPIELVMEAGAHDICGQVKRDPTVMTALSPIPRPRSLPTQTGRRGFVVALRQMRRSRAFPARQFLLCAAGPAKIEISGIAGSPSDGLRPSAARLASCEEIAHGRKPILPFASCAPRSRRHRRGADRDRRSRRSRIRGCRCVDDRRGPWLAGSG